MAQCEWEKVRALIRRELTRTPADHWLLTQLGVTLYEEGRYSEALKPLVESWQIVPDCPLTLWNLAGTLIAIGKPELALSIYSWILGSSKTSDDDACWESTDWTEALKTDCVYRLGTCLQRLGQSQQAAVCFRQYVELLLSESKGTYSIEDVSRQLHQVNGNGKPHRDRQIRGAISAVLRDAGIRGTRSKAPKLTVAEILTT